jgi:serine/threonine protein kinase/tetratricopeptide (TPR) repeat protein
MIGTTVSHYKILEKLGEGGMGVVYKAHDTKLDRDVALKFLPHQLTATADEQARFLQEARAASALNHPNVCVIHDIQEYQGQQFIVMEYVDGRTLRQLVPLQKTQTAIDYAIQIGDALQEAHSKGIIHRDVKTDNIMVNSKNQIKVMDFGLAKLKGSLKLTKTSSTVGTLGYMAPEQIQGEPVDARSDVFSFGAVLYEMLTGHLPFRGEHEAAVIYSILNEEPMPVQNFLRDVSPELIHILTRALEKDREDRYQTMHDMVIDLRRLKKQTSRVSGMLLSQLPSDRLPLTRRRLALIATAILLLLGIVCVYILLFKNEEPINSIAVLPFVNDAVNPDVEYLSDGITESIINSLSQIRSLRVIPRGTAFSYKGKNINVEEVARKLNVRAVLTGKVVQKGDDLHIQTELVDAVHESQLWGQQYVRRVSDVLDVQREVVQEVSNRLDLRLGTEDNKRLTTGLTKDKEAYQLYLKGRYHWNRRTGDGLRKAIKHFEEAIERDPLYGSAFAGLADCYDLLSYYGPIAPAEAYPKAKAAARRALEIDSSIAEAHTALAYYYARYEWNWVAAEHEFLRALQLNPNYPTGHQWYAEFLSSMGRHEEAIREIKRAQELDPLSLIINTVVGNLYSMARKYHEALDQHRKTIEMDSTFLYAQFTLIGDYESLGLHSNSIQQWLKYLEMSGAAGLQAQLRNGYAHNGPAGFWEKFLEFLLESSKRGYTPPYQIAYMYCHLGQKDQAIAWLQRGVEIHDEWMIYLNQWFEYDSVRHDPRFIALVKKVGLEK